MVGPDFPVFFRLNARERIKGGQTIEDALKAGKLLVDAGVDVLDVSLISQGSWKEVDDKIMLAGASALPKDKPSGANVALSLQFKNETNVPVIAVGKFGFGERRPHELQD